MGDLDIIEREKQSTYTIPDFIPSAYYCTDTSTFCRLEQDEKTAPLSYYINWDEISTQTLKCSPLDHLTGKVKIVEAVTHAIQNVNDKGRKFIATFLLDWAVAYNNNDLTRPLFPQTYALVRSLYQETNQYVSKSLQKRRQQLPISSFISPSAGLLVWLETPLKLDE